MQLLHEQRSSREVSGEWGQAGVVMMFEKVGLTSVLGSAMERLVQGLIIEEVEEGGITSASQCRFVGNAWCQFDRIIWGV